MAVAFRAAGSLVSASTISVTVGYPAGVASGDLLVMQYACYHVTTPTTPSGWTVLLGPVAVTGTSPATDCYVYYRIAGASEPGSVTVTGTGGNQVAGIMAAYTGADTTTPFDVSATAQLASSGNTATAPTVTTTKPNTLLLHMLWTYVTGGTVTPNASDSERYDSYSAGTSLGFEMADKAQAATGATGTSSATTSNSMFGGLAATIAIAPPGGITPVANFTGTPTTGAASLSVAFTDSSTNTPTSWDWDFGDGSSHGTTQNPTHSYTTPGIYTVVLVATNSAGSNTKTRSGYITVAEAIVYAATGGIDIY